MDCARLVCALCSMLVAVIVVQGVSEEEQISAVVSGKYSFLFRLLRYQKCACNTVYCVYHLQQTVRKFVNFVRCRSVLL